MQIGKLFNLSYSKTIWYQRRNLHSKEVRRLFVDFFKQRSHEHLPSSSLLPYNDPTLLFTNAGMNQFKEKFLNTVKPESDLEKVKRAVTYQKCIRVGGKHNDLNDVGFDTSHHTFFEMLGSWSFGNYSKMEACAMALDLLTNVYKLPQSQLYVTYFGGSEELNIPPDVETKHIWKKLGFSDDRVLPFSEADNFWEMGESGPCGPCTEIHYDNVGNRNASEFVNNNHCDVVELWNIVFITHNRTASNQLKLLPAMHIDTGMGLERLVCVLQGKKSNYDTDLFVPIINSIKNICSCPGYEGRNTNEIDIAYRTISDHIRMVVMAISDDICPSQTSAGLQVRHVIQRALLAAEKMCAPPNILSLLVPSVVNSLQDAYPALSIQEKQITEVITEAETSFHSIHRRCNEAITRTLVKNEHCRIDFPVQEAIQLCNQHHLPKDLFGKTLLTYDIIFDIKEFERQNKEMENLLKRKAMRQKRELVDISPDVISLLKDNIPLTNDDVKYEMFLNNPLHCKVLALVDDSGVQMRDDSFTVEADKPYAIVLDKTNMYAEDGGQISDEGAIHFGEKGLFNVENVTNMSGFVFHFGKFREDLGMIEDEEARMEVDEEHREGCMRAHTAAHLLNFVARKLAKKNVEQKGQKVSVDQFAFKVNSSFTNDQVIALEEEVRRMSADGLKMHSFKMKLSEVEQNKGIRRINVPYPNFCNVIGIGTNDPNKAFEYSVELCGGTHVKSTLAIIDFVIISSKSTGSNLTEFKCLTGKPAQKAFEITENLKDEVQSFLNEAETSLNQNKSVVEFIELRSKSGHLLSKINKATMSSCVRKDLKYELREQSKKLGSKIRKLQKSQWR